MRELRIHDLVLVGDAFHVNRIKVFGYKFLTQAQFIAFGESPFQNTVPAIGLQDGDIVIFFVLADMLCHFHPLAQDLHQFIIQVIDCRPIDGFIC